MELSIPNEIAAIMLLLPIILNTLIFIKLRNLENDVIRFGTDTIEILSVSANKGEIIVELLRKNSLDIKLKKAYSSVG